MHCTGGCFLCALHEAILRRTQSLGIVIGGTILQNELLAKLPADFTSTLPKGVQVAYAIIPQIQSLPDGVKDEVRGAFAGSVRVIWQVMIGISGAGLLTCLLMKELPLRTDMDETWGLQEKERGEEKGAEAGAGPSSGTASTEG